MKKLITAKLAELALEREKALANLHAIAGAEQMLAQLLKDAEREENADAKDN